MCSRRPRRRCRFGGRMTTQMVEKTLKNKPIATISVRPDGVAILTLDDPNAELNTITRDFGGELRPAAPKIENDPAVKAAVIASGKKGSFVVGANIDMLKAVTRATEIEEMSREF